MATLPRRKSSGLGNVSGTTPRSTRGAHGPSLGMRDHGSSASMPRGGVVAPPPPNAWGRQSAERSTPPLITSPAVSVGSRYKMACRDRWINLTKTMMGEKAEIITSSRCTYEGVLHVLTPLDPTPGQQGRKGGMYQVVLRAATLKEGSPACKGKVDSRGGTIIISGEDIVSIIVKRLPIQSAPRPLGLATDSDIGGKAERVGGSRDGARELQKADASWVNGPEELSLSSKGGGGGGAGKWDQFAANQRLFKVTSSFDENLYTTPLDKRSLTRDQMVHAERMAAEIESKSSGNIHMREERNMLTEQDKAMGEEERFSSVLGTGGLTHQHQTHRAPSAGSGSNGNSNSNSNINSIPAGRFVSSNRPPTCASPGGSGHMHTRTGSGSCMGGPSGSSNSKSNSRSGSKSPVGPGVYVPPALRAMGSGGDAVSPTTIQIPQRDRGSPSLVAASNALKVNKPEMTSTTSPSPNMRNTDFAAAGAEACSEEAKEAAKAQLMDVLDGKMRSAIPKGENDPSSSTATATTSPAVTADPLDPTPSAPQTADAIAKSTGASVTVTSSTRPRSTSVSTSTETSALHATVVASSSGNNKSAAFVPAPTLAMPPKKAMTSSRKIPAPVAAVGSNINNNASAMAASSVVSSSMTLTTPTASSEDKKKSTLRASAREWKPNPAAKEWKPTVAPATVVSAASPARSSSGGGFSDGHSARGRLPGGSMGYTGTGGTAENQDLQQQQQQQQQVQNVHRLPHHLHGHHSPHVQQQQQQQQGVPPYTPLHQFPHPSQQNQHHQHGQQHHSLQPGPQQQQQHGQYSSPPLQQPSQPPSHHLQNPHVAPHSGSQQGAPLNVPPPPSPSRAQQHSPNGPPTHAGQQQSPHGAGQQQQQVQSSQQASPQQQLMVTQFPPGAPGMHAQMAVAVAAQTQSPAAAGAGNNSPSGGQQHPHMVGVPPGAHAPHMMGPHGPMPGQQFPMQMYRTAMSHPQQMFMQPQPGGMRIPMTPDQVQGFPPQGVPMMGQPGGPPGAPFFHGQIQGQQQQQQQQQQQRGFAMISGHPAGGALPPTSHQGPPQTPPQRPGSMGRMMSAGPTMASGAGGGRMSTGGPQDNSRDGHADGMGGGHARRGRGGGRGSGVSRQTGAPRKHHRGGSTG